MSSGNQIFPSSMFSSWPAQDSGVVLADLIQSPERPSLPEKLTLKVLREAIASALADVKAYDLAGECVRFGLPAQADDEEGPWNGKWRYVERRIRHWKLPSCSLLRVRSPRSTRTASSII
jgi:hypothetical protein